MPLPLILAGMAIGGVGGFVLGDGVDGASRVVKWSVIGGGAMLLWSQRRAIAGAFK